MRLVNVITICGMVKDYTGYLKMTIFVLCYYFSSISCHTHILHCTVSSNQT